MQVNSSHGKISVTAWAVGKVLCIQQAMGLTEKPLIQPVPNPLFLFCFVFCSAYLPSIPMSLEFRIFSALGINNIALCVCTTALLLICNALSKTPCSHPLLQVLDQRPPFPWGTLAQWLTPSLKVLSKWFTYIYM